MGVLPSTYTRVPRIQFLPYRRLSGKRLTRIFVRDYLLILKLVASGFRQFSLQNLASAFSMLVGICLCIEAFGCPPLNIAYLVKKNH